MVKINNMEVKLLNINEIKENESNPRFIKEDKLKSLIKSVDEFQKMLSIRPIVVNKNMIIIGGNMRYRACKELNLQEIPVFIADNLTEEEEKEFIIKDNISGGEWDFEILANEWDVEQLEDWGLDLPSFDVNSNNEKNDLSDNIETNFRIEIILNDEKTQELLYNELISRNYECRLLTL